MMKALVYGVIGGIVSCILFSVLFNGIGLRDDIVTGTIVLSIVICACTGIVVEKIDTK